MEEKHVMPDVSGGDLAEKNKEHNTWAIVGAKVVQTTWSVECLDPFI